MTSTIDVYRGTLIESRHHVSIAVMRADGTMAGWSGDPELTAFWRSCAKPFQATPMIVDGAADALGFGPDALALACASHNGEEPHVALARRMLAASGATDDDLVCGPHASLNENVAKAMAARGEQPTRAHNNCSGKHAGMVGYARHAQWGSTGYALPGHPLQQRLLDEVARWCALPVTSVPHATDGCGVPCFSLPLSAMALAWARLAAAAAGDRVKDVPRESQQAVVRLVEAMTLHPFLVAGTARLDTDLIEASQGRILAKVGAEGVYCAAIPSERLGIALKVEDGANRCLGPALLGLLDVLVPSLVPPLESHRRCDIFNTLGNVVGRIEPRMILDRAASK